MQTSARCSPDSSHPAHSPAPVAPRNQQRELCTRLPLQPSPGSKRLVYMLLACLFVCCCSAAGTPLACANTLCPASAYRCGCQRTVSPSCWLAAAGTTAATTAAAAALEQGQAPRWLQLQCRQRWEVRCWLLQLASWFGGGGASEGATCSEQPISSRRSPVQLRLVWIRQCPTGTGRRDSPAQGEWQGGVHAEVCVLWADPSCLPAGVHTYTHHTQQACQQN